jgi:YesN/AraC family two-component response regulator
MKNLRILIVDDEVIIRETLRELLEIEGASVVEADNGNTAFALIQKRKFDLIISDVRMPVCSGTDLLKKIRAYDKKAPEIILISGFTDLTNEKAMDLGASGFLMKPQVMANLKELISDIMD